jgi:ligand-binding sensor domain-containing protein
LVALTDRALLWRDPKNGQWTMGPEIAPQIGRARALADGANGVWVAGSRGVGFARIGGPIERTLPVGSALPEEAWDLSTDGEWLWVATSKGVVRFRREGLEP